MLQHRLQHMQQQRQRKPLTAPSPPAGPAGQTIANMTVAQLNKHVERVAREAGSLSGAEAATTAMAKRDLPCKWGDNPAGLCIWTEHFPNTEHDQESVRNHSKTMGIPLHHYGVMSTEYGQKRDVLYSKFKVCRFCRDGRGVLCSYASEN